MKIQKLPADTFSKLESGVVITDAVQCVLELVHNSLDAEASSIAVRVDLKNYQIQVIDNGRGICKEDLEFVGQRFMTSKLNPFDLSTSVFTYGFKGQAISSLVDVCKSLTIESKSNDNEPAHIKVFHNKKAQPIIESNAEKVGTGTTVTINDFMHLMPVRQLRISEVFDVEGIKTQLQYLAVVHYNVCFTLQNGTKGLIAFQKHPTSNLLQSISSIFGKSITKHLKPLKYQEEKYEITGFISVKSQKQKLQLLYVNKRIVIKSLIHKFLNNLLKEYSESTLFKDSSIEQEIMLKKLKNNFYNVFILELKCPCSCYEIFTNLRKTKVEFKNWNKVLKCVYKAIKKTFKFYGRSLSSSDHILNYQYNKILDKKDSQAKFGTSVLVNAVRGAPVRRGFNKEVCVNKKRGKNENLTNVQVPSNEEEIKNCNSREKFPGQNNNLLFCLNDSFESPIPKNQLIALSQQKPSEFEKLSLNESFIEFYEWLKTKFQTDAKAYNLYKDFLRHKEKNNQEFLDGKAFKSPVLGKNPKRRNILISSCTKLTNVEETNGPNYRSKAGDGRLTVKRKRYADLPPAVIERTETAKNFSTSERLNSEFTGIESLKFGRKNGGEMLNNSRNLPFLSKAQRQMEIHYARPSPAASELFFANIINFRNLSASFGCLPSDTRRGPVNYYYPTVTNTWTSHYKDFGPGIIQKKARLKEDFSLFENCRAFEIQRRREKNLEKYGNQKKARFSDLSAKRTAVIRFHDAEIQADMSQIIYTPQKVNAAMQSDNSKAAHVAKYEAVGVICESPCFENDKYSRMNIRDLGLSYRGTNDLSQEFSYPDFWNFLTPENFNRIAPFPDFKTSREENSSVEPVDKASYLSELCCGQKSGSGTKTQSGKSASKETQTLAVMWSEFLKDIESYSGGVIGSTANNPSSESPQLPKTIPVYELVDVSAITKSNFWVTERHDFVPKGLSPKYPNSEPPKTLLLSPRERQKIKSIISDSENELLGSVKWQDESTGGSTKPTIPDGTLDEIREKAEKNLIYYENEILSASLSYCAIKVHNLLHSFAFTKELLSGVEILGQLDKKFIIARMELFTPHRMELISLFDQHAVDERIKLEKLMHDYTTADGRLILCCLNPPIECVLGDLVVQLVSNLQENLSSSGLSIEIVNKETIFFKNVPVFLLDKHEKNCTTKKESDLVETLKAWIINVAEEITETRGAPPKIPKVVHDAFCSEACHRAIKFNKELTKETMVDMINKLKNCKLPFQCAHGRPSVIPIIDLQDFNPLVIEGESVDVSKIEKFARARRTQGGVIKDSEEVRN